MKHKLTTEEFIKRSKEIHGANKYNYDKCEYINSHEYVELFCNTHQCYFKIKAYSHINSKQGCRICGIERRARLKTHTTEQFIEKAIEIHGNKYSYHETEYIHNNKVVKIWCNTHNEFFYITPISHISQKSGCHKCGKETTRIKTSSNTEEFTKKAIKIHGDKYSYNNVDYINNEKPVEIFCKKCNKPFTQTPNSHLSQKAGCPICSKRQKLTTEEFIKRAKEIHGDKYNYDKVEYKNIDENVEIYCNKHKSFFKQTPGSHITQKAGCPICRTSKGEESISKWLNENDMVFEKEKTFPDCKNITLLRFDFYLPLQNILIEYDGIQHFIPQVKFGGEKGLKYLQINDNIKNEYCIRNNIKLIRITYKDNIEETLNSSLKTTQSLQDS